MKARVTAVGDTLDLNVREEADPTRVRARDATADASDEEEDYGHLGADGDFEEGETVWYTNSEGEEVKARVKSVGDGAILCSLSARLFGSPFAHRLLTVCLPTAYRLFVFCLQFAFQLPTCC